MGFFSALSLVQGLTTYRRKKIEDFLPFVPFKRVFGQGSRTHGPSRFWTCRDMGSQVELLLI